MKIKCPHCGFEGEAKDYFLLYEAVVNVSLYYVFRESRERPPLLICPKCNKTFVLEEHYEIIKRKLRKR